ncbi:MAG: sigma-54-dependent Fis family transcriptional regulator [Gemmatimonadetes bacterium]|nr:sigma-54-dependent Fis family transcriptional regulator [Gemmatimonadota bacterium]
MTTRALLASLLLGDAPAISRLRETIALIAPSTVPVVIEGETGTGKEVVADALHRLSGRTGRFVPVNVCAIAESMAEDALFGHERGAFTGAAAESSGYLLAAHRGTLLLDEVAGMPSSLQAKLLRAIETREVWRVGGNAGRASDFRVLAATNVSLGALVSRGALRIDLAHRLNGITLRIPPLRDRLADVVVLAQHFLWQYRRDGGGDVTLSDGLKRLLLSHSWPGNVRELRQVMETASVLAGAGPIGARLVEELLQGTAPASTKPIVQQSAQRHAIVSALRAAAGSAHAAASLLGVSRATLYRRVSSLGIELQEFRDLGGSRSPDGPVPS